MDIKSQSLFSEMQSMAAEARLDALRPNQSFEVNPSQHNFSDMLGQAINNVNSMQLDAKQQQIDFELGKGNMSLADVMLAKEKSGLAFQATVQVRNKVLEAYKQIMNMPV